MDMSAFAAYGSAATCLEQARTTRVALFRSQWNLQSPGWDTSKTSQFVTALSDDADLTPTALAVNGGDVFAEFMPIRRRPCAAPPGPPRDVQVVSNSGGVVVLSWIRPEPGHISYVLEAGHAPGSTEVMNSELGPATTFRAAGVKPGTYYARVVSKNACGVSAPSSEITVTVG